MRIVFIGTGEIGVPSLQALLDSERVQVIAIITQPDRPVGRHQEIKPSPIKQVATASSVPLFQPEKINTPEMLLRLQELQPDLMIVCAYGQILKASVLGIPRLGCLNLHASLLPKYRGAACIQAAIKNRDAETGMTVMWMDEGLDTGAVFLQNRFAIEPQETAGSLHDRLAKSGPEILLSALALLEKGQAIKIPQEEALATYVKKLGKEDGKIDWKVESHFVEAHIRAMIPWPGAYTVVEVGGEKKTIKIFQAVLDQEICGKPGEIVRLSDEGISVAAGQGGLRLKELQLEGRKRMAAGELARGTRLQPGQFLE
jgi:methionyl-tRNA formyltransferase